MIQVCLGGLYAWSAFTRRLTIDPYNFSRTETQVIFAVALVTFAVVPFAAPLPIGDYGGPRSVADGPSGILYSLALSSRKTSAVTV